MTFQPPKHFFFFLFRICCWVHSVATLPITKSRYSFIGRWCLQQTSGTGWRFSTMDSDGAAFSLVITHEPAGHRPFSFYFTLNGYCPSVLSWAALFCINSVQSHHRRLGKIIAMNTKLTQWFSFHSVERFVSIEKKRAKGSCLDNFSSGLSSILQYPFNTLRLIIGLFLLDAFPVNRFL